MKQYKSLCVLGVAMGLLLGVFVSLNSDVKREPVPPQTKYKLKDMIPEDIRKEVDKKIEADNDELFKLLDLLKSVDADQIDELAPWFSKAFEKTYLKKAELEDHEGNPVVGWKAILGKLKEYADQPFQIYVESVDLEVDFLKYKDTKPDLADDVDLKMIVRTKLKVGSTATLSGCLLHRRTCTPIECE